MGVEAISPHLAQALCLLTSCTTLYAASLGLLAVRLELPVTYCLGVHVCLPEKLENLRQDRLSRMDAEPVNRHID